MAGHSKWSNIKHRKAGQDAKRGKIFTKIIRELTIAARDGGGSLDDNPSLRTVVDKANKLLKIVEEIKDTGKERKKVLKKSGGCKGRQICGKDSGS